MPDQQKIIILSGPSCAGKTPLLDALERTHPHLDMARPVLYTSRDPRPIETDGEDYHFRSEAEVKSFKPDQFVIGKTRNVWQAVDVRDVLMLLETHQYIVFDIYPTLGEKLMQHPRLTNADTTIERVFIQPATEDEIRDVRQMMGEASMQQAFAAMRTPHLISRALIQGKDLTPEVMADINVRVNAAWGEFLIGKSYDHIIYNHDGEDSPHWQHTPPTGEAGETLEKFVDILTS